MSSTTDTLDDIDLAAARPSCRQGAGVVPAVGERAAVRHHRPVVGVRPDHRHHPPQGPGAEPAGGMVVRADPRHRRQPPRLGARPEPHRRPHRHPVARRGGGARLHHRRHLDLAVAAVRRRGAHHLRLRPARRARQEHGAADRDHHPHHQGRGRRPRRADHVRSRGRGRPGRTRRSGSRCAMRRCRCSPSVSAPQRRPGSSWPTPSTSSAWPSTPAR